MSLRISEPDWKVFRELHAVALERFCQRVIEQVRSTTDSCGDNYHDCFAKVLGLMIKSDKKLARTFDDFRRSTAVIQLALIKREGLLTADELMRFSEEARKASDPLEY